jgi:hypothetical protein
MLIKVKAKKHLMRGSVFRGNDAFFFIFDTISSYFDPYFIKIIVVNLPCKKNTLKLCF